MKKTLDQLIQEANDALQKTEEGSQERIAAQARLDALNSVKEAGFTKTQDDLNRLDARAKREHENSVKEVLGMTLEEAKQIVEGFEDSLGEGDEEGNVLERMQAALEERDRKINDLSTSHQDFQRRYYAERVTNRLDSALKGAGLNEKYLDPAKRLASYDELVEKSMRGEEVEDEDFERIASSIKEQAPVFFEPERNDDHPGVPPSPEVRVPQEITDQQRAERSAPVF